MTRLQRLEGAFAVARAWRAPSLAIATGVQLGLAVWMDGPLTVPGRLIREVVTPFAPLGFAFAAVAGSQALIHAAVEARHPRRTQRRLRFVAMVIAVGALSSLVASLIGSASWLQLLRNLAFFVGAVLLVRAEHMPSMLTAITVYSSACWIIGATGEGTPPQIWALPLHGETHAGAALVAAMTLAVGTLRFAGARPRAR